MLRSFKQDQRMSAMGADTIQNAASPKSQKSRRQIDQGMCILFAVICLSVLGAYAQEAGAMRWGVATGVDFTKQKYSGVGLELTIDRNQGFKRLY